MTLNHPLWGDSQTGQLVVIKRRKAQFTWNICKLYHHCSSPSNSDGHLYVYVLRLLPNFIIYLFWDHLQSVIWLVADLSISSLETGRCLSPFTKLDSVWSVMFLHSLALLFCHLSCSSYLTCLFWFRSFGSFSCPSAHSLSLELS